MNEDFSEIFSKFQDILKDKNIDLNNIAGEEPSPPAENSDFSIDINTILKIKEIITKINKNSNCPRNKLLYSLKPYLEKSKKEKLDQYIKIANLLSVMENTEFGINLFNKEKENGYDIVLIITLFLLII